MLVEGQPGECFRLNGCFSTMATAMRFKRWILRVSELIESIPSVFYNDFELEILQYSIHCMIEMIVTTRSRWCGLLQSTLVLTTASSEIFPTFIYNLNAIDIVRPPEHPLLCTKTFNIQHFMIFVWIISCSFFIHVSKMKKKLLLSNIQIVIIASEHLDLKLVRVVRYSTYSELGVFKAWMIRKIIRAFATI